MTKVQIALEQNKNNLNFYGNSSLILFFKWKLDTNFGDIDMNFVVEILKKEHSIYSLNFESKTKYFYK